MSKKPSTVQEKEISTQNTMEDANFDFTDQLAVPPAILQEIKDKNLAHRWVNAAKLAANYGFDSRQWTPYKPEKTPGGMFSGVDSEGYIRRGDLILAVQSQQLNAKRRAIIDAKNARNKGHNKQAAEMLKEAFKKSGVKAKISEGFDENEQYT